MIVSEVLDTLVGDVHITPEQIMDVNIGTYGPGDYVLTTGRKCEAELITNNMLRIFDGTMVYGGIRDVIPVNGYHDVVIENGTQGMFRNDVVVRYFKKDEVTKYGAAEFKTIRGTPSETEAEDPEVQVTDLRGGALEHSMKMYRVKLEGLNVVGVEPLFETIGSLEDFKKEVTELTSKSIKVTTKSYPITFKHNSYLGTLLGEMSIPHSEIEENGDIMSVQVQCADNAPGSVKWSISNNSLYIVATSLKSISANIVVTYLKYD